jgi:hypothetical protein
MVHEYAGRCHGARCSTAINAFHSAAPVPAAPLMRLEVARDLAVMRETVEQLANKVDQLAAKQDQMSQNIAASQAVEQDITEERSSPPLSESVSPPPRKKARRVASRKLTAQSSSSPPPAFTHSDAHPSFFMAIGPSGGVGLSYEPRGVYPTGKALK